MNVNEEIQNFIETKIKESAVFKRFFESGFCVYYEATPENPRRPYIRYTLNAPVVEARDLQMEFTAYQCMATINIVGNSLEQVRLLSEELFNIFDGKITLSNFPNIEDVASTYPEENVSFDAQTSRETFETAQSLTFHFIV